MVKTAGKVAISGEDRMLGSSLLWGAESVLVGLGAASVNLSVDLFHSFLLADFGRFKRASTLLDQFAKMTFAKPYEGYIQRMMWVAAAEGLIPSDQATDPFGPPLPKSEQLGLLTMLSHLKSTPAYLAQRHK